MVIKIVYVPNVILINQKRRKNDKIIFKKWAVQEFEIDDEKYLSIKEEDIIATYEL